MGTQNSVLTWIGWVITGLIGLLMVFSAVMKLSNSPEVTDAVVNTFGYSADVLPVLAILEICCVLLYLLPQTAVLGAVLLTGYLGGAVATHVRIHDHFIVPVVIGIFVWLALYLRDPRVRALLPFRWPMA
jgi:hypothetical protein